MLSTLATMVRLDWKSGPYQRRRNSAISPADAESDLYHSAAAHLRYVGWPVVALDCTRRRPETIALSIITPVLQIHAERSQA